MAHFNPEMPPPALLAAVAISLVASLAIGRERADAEAPPAERSAPVVSLAGLDVERLKLATRIEPMRPGNAASPPIETSAVIDAALEIPPPTLPPQRRAPPAPAAPPLPFSYLGKMIDGDKTLVFVGRGADHYSVEPGLTIDDTYRVEKITDTTVTFMFLPSKTRQILAVPSLSE